MSAGAPGMDDPLGNSLVVEMRDLFPENEILEKGRAAVAALETVLIVGDDEALVGRQGGIGG